MKTTFNLPDDLLHRAKITAAQRKTTPKELVIQCLEHSIRVPFQGVDSERKERAAKLIAALSCGRNSEPVGRLKREDPVVETSVALARRAFHLKTRFDIRYWDAAVNTAALELGCHTLYSEDLNHGQDYEGVRVLNPFV